MNQILRKFKKHPSYYFLKMGVQFLDEENYDFEEEDYDDEDDDLFESEFHEWLIILQEALSRLKTDEKIVQHVKRDLGTNPFADYKGLQGSEIFKKLFDKRFYEKDFLMALIDKIHIKFELMFDAILNDQLHTNRFNITKKSGFWNKLQVLKESVAIDEDLFNDFRTFNELRNKLVHVDDYDIVHFPVNKFTYCENLYNYAKTDTQEVRRYVNLYLIKYIIFFMLGRLDMDFPIVRTVKSEP